VSTLVGSMVRHRFVGYGTKIRGIQRRQPWSRRGLTVYVADPRAVNFRVCDGISPYLRRSEVSDMVESPSQGRIANTSLSGE
jgi:hypothetical protein